MTNRNDTALAVVDGPADATIVRAVDSDSMRTAIAEYRRIQDVLDHALPDAIQRIAGRAFRKKAYWRAICTAFNLHVELQHEERIELDGDWGYLVTYLATAPNGRTASGDGACMASEKARNQATLHNVRGHAHTRAYNRAVSNLVGFGEVSAEEVDREQTIDRRASRTDDGMEGFWDTAEGIGWTRTEVYEICDQYKIARPERMSPAHRLKLLDRLAALAQDAQTRTADVLDAEATSEVVEEPAAEPKKGKAKGRVEEPAGDVSDWTG